MYFRFLRKYFSYFTVYGISADPAVHMAVIVSNLIGLFIFDGQYFMEIEVPVYPAKHYIPFAQRRIFLHWFRNNRLSGLEYRGHGLPEALNYARFAFPQLPRGDGVFFSLIQNLYLARLRMGFIAPFSCAGLLNEKRPLRLRSINLSE